MNWIHRNITTSWKKFEKQGHVESNLLVKTDVMQRLVWQLLNIISKILEYNNNFGNVLKCISYSCDKFWTLFQFNLHNSSWFTINCMYNEQIQTALKTGENVSILVSGAWGTDRMAYLLEYHTDLVHYLFHDFSLLYYCEYGNLTEKFPLSVAEIWTFCG